MGERRLKELRILERMTDPRLDFGSRSLGLGARALLALGRGLFGASGTGL